MFGFIGKIFGTSNDRNLKRMQKFVDAINSLDEDYSSKEDNFYSALKSDLSKKFSQNNDLYSILPEAFAAVREAGKRTIGLRHFDAQMLGGIALAEGNIAEMKTGEGKTLVATLPTFLNSAMGNKVILVTVNDYLAKRDAEWMRPIYEFLGLSVGVIYSGQELSKKAAAYDCDVIYATNNELGFDYCFNYKTQNIDSELGKLGQDYVNMYFDNVGGEISDAVMNHLAVFSRTAVCGQIANYNASSPPVGPRVARTLLTKQSLMQGFIVFNFEHKFQ